MSTVEETRPPITTIANGPEMNAPPPVNPSAMGIKAKIVAHAVMMIGRNRSRAPSTIAVRRSSPRRRY